MNESSEIFRFGSWIISCSFDCWFLVAVLEGFPAAFPLIFSFFVFDVTNSFFASSFRDDTVVERVCGLCSVGIGLTLFLVGA